MAFDLHLYTPCGRDFVLKDICQFTVHTSGQLNTYTYGGSMEERMTDEMEMFFQEDLLYIKGASLCNEPLYTYP